MKDAKIFSNSVDFLSAGGPWKEGLELDWESYVDNYESWIDWKNCDGNLKSWVDNWKNYDYDWDIGSGLTFGGHCCFGFMRNSGNFSSQDVRLSTGLLWGLEKAEFIGS